ncbi:MAG: DNA-methyltransferase, partial [Dehalococcoidia bacterium]
MSARALPRRRLLIGDARTRLAELPRRSVDCVITSPPYFLLRDYQVDGQIGLEPNVNGWVDQLLEVLDELARLLKPSGGLWLNLGDSYSRHSRYGAPAKSLLLGPERLLLQLAARGWIVRNKLVWAKPNPMPTSVRDRLTCSWEPIYFLVRSGDYFFDLDAIREAHRSERRAQTHPPTRDKYGGRRPSWAGPLAGTNSGLVKNRMLGRAGHPLGKNPGDVWSIAKAQFRGAHFATFPVALLEKPLLATCPERVCAGCGRPWQRGGGSLRADCECGAAWQPG